MRRRPDSIRKGGPQAGFTILELMIATAVLSTILLLVTALMMNIGNLYYKGVNQTRVQDDVRTIADDVAQQLKYSGSSFYTGQGTKTIMLDGKSIDEQAYCIGNIRYTYFIGYQIGNGTDADGTTPQVPAVLWRDANPQPGACPWIARSDLGTDRGGTEMVAPNSRLTSFCIGTLQAGGGCDAASGSPYTITVGVAYGGIDLLNGSTDSPGTFATCKDGLGDRFCATAHLTTLVSARTTGSP